MRSRLAAALLGSFALMAGCTRASAAPDGTSPVFSTMAAPRLIVLITVDQLRGDMLQRYERQLSHGYKRLMDGGAWFVNAYQDHAITETAPGHASTLSGRFPRSTGIASNSAGVVDPKYRLVVGTPNELGASPDRFRGTALYDWLHAKDSRARALSISMKDRGAILPIGKARQDVYWYSGTGAFTTSTYYRDDLPDWVREFNARGLPYTYAGGSWRLSRPASAYQEPDSVPLEKGGRDFMFPHEFPADSAGAANYLRATPMMDSITALLALEGLRRTGIGTGPQTDVMAVSFSATDYVGHAYGPDSREAHENELRLDETLGWFLDSLYALRDSSTVMVALTADHGVQPIPELARQRGQATGEQGLRVSLRRLVGDVRAGLSRAGVDSSAFYYDGEAVAINRVALARANVSADSVLNAFAEAARAVPGVARVDRLRELRRADLTADPIARRWTHQFSENSAIDLVITLTRYSLWGSIPATHGSPWDQDAHVPVIFYGPWVKPGRYTEFARVVDIGPTLAAIAGARPLEPLDGRALTTVIR